MSELREILSRIDAEIACLKQAQSYAVTARHQIIQRKLEVLSLAYAEMEPIIGSDHAVAVLNRSMERMYEALQEEKPQ